MRLRFCLVVLALAGITPAFAAYPDHPIRLVVPYTAGGPGDILGRMVAAQVGANLGQPVIVENKPGAGLAVGAGYVARARADGYVLLEGAASMLAAPTPGRSTEQNLHDFAPVSQIGSLPEVLVINKNLPVKNVREFIAYAKTHPVFYGSSGIGSLTHLSGALFAQMAGVKMVHAPYRGINEAMTDLIAGRVQAVFAGAPIGLPQARSGQVRALAVTSATRFAGAPDMPTIAESGLSGYDVSPWYGVLAPVGTPPDVMKRLHDAIAKAMQSPDIRKRMLSLGADNVFSKTPEEFGALMRAENRKWSSLVQQEHIKLQ